MEKWEKIPGYEDYKVSNLGNIISLKFGKTKKLKLNKTNSGYFNVSISKNGLSKNFYVHRLVMKTFVGESELDVNHKNGIKTDNRVENLEYVTKSQNQKHRFQVLGHKYVKENIIRNKKVGLFNEYGKLIQERGSISEASVDLSLSNCYISRMCNGKTKKVGKIKLRFI